MIYLDEELSVTPRQILVTLLRDMSRHPPRVPRLLVSVRSRAEASRAVAGGCDILDLKEPTRGSLGMVDLQVAEEVVRSIKDVPLSFALGELSDWQQIDSLPLLPAGITYCKIGLSGQASHPHWQETWQCFRERMDDRAARHHNWIAVIYADYQRAGAPAPEAVLEAAANTKCAGVLFDTYSKTEGNVFECFSPDELSRLVARIHSTGLLVALAGSLSLNHLPSLLPYRPDIVAVRGSVCRELRRTSEVEESRVRLFKEALLQISNEESVPPQLIEPV